MDTGQVVGIISNVLQVVQQIGNTPGVNLIPYVSTVTSVVGALNQLIQAEQDIEPLALKLAATFKKDAPPPTAEELAALDADIEAELAKLRAMPDKDPDEPE